MFRVASVKGGLTGVKQYISSYCDEHDEEEDHIGNAEPDDYNDGGDIVQQVCFVNSINDNGLPSLVKYASLSIS